MPDRTCSVDGCDDLAKCGGMCLLHYHRWYRAEVQSKRALPCRVEGCERPAGVPGTVKDYCGPHYRRLKVYGDPLGKPDYINKGKSCSVDGCSDPAKERGLCVKHYTRWQRHRSTDHPEEWGRAPTGQRWCGTCKTYKAIDEFYSNRSRTYGLSTSCVVCDRARQVAYRKRNPHRSREYAKKRYRRLGGRSISGLEIAVRDGWTCQICRRAIDRRIHYPDPMSLSIDHIVPVSKWTDDLGPTPHVKSNVQASHLVCNNRKKAGGVSQLLLFG